MPREPFSKERLLSLPNVVNIDPLLPKTTPSFDAFVAYTHLPTVTIQLLENSPRNLRQLYSDIYGEREVSIIVENGERKRYGKVAAVDVYYQVPNGPTYKLEEERFTLRPGRTMQEFISGDESAVVASSPRPALKSVSERIKLDGETPQDAVARALYEELFAFALEGKEPRQKARVKQALKEEAKKHTAPFPIRVERDAHKTDTGNSYLGMKSVLDIYEATSIFTPSTQLPLLDAGGKLQTLYEYIPQERYVNRFCWKPVEMLPADIYSARRRFALLPAGK